jgi:hypothetical protein
VAVRGRISPPKVLAAIVALGVYEKGSN